LRCGTPNPNGSLLERTLKNKVGVVRQQQGRNAKTNCCIVDAQSVKNIDCVRGKGYRAGEKLSGIKRHIAVDSQGLPHAIVVTTAEVTDIHSGKVIEAIRRNRGNLLSVARVLVDGSYTVQLFAEIVQSRGHRCRPSNGVN